MSNISYWASRHVLPARLLLAICYVLLNGLGFVIGKALQDAEIQLPYYMLYALAVPFTLAWCTYPKRQHKYNYTARKLRDSVLITVTFLQVICLSNQQIPWLSMPQPAWSSQGSLIDNPATEIKASEAKKPLLLKNKMRQKLRENIRLLRQHYRQAPTGEKVALIVLSIIGALALLYAVAALSCGIACSGSEGLALFVAILGTGLVAFLLIRVIRAINRKHRAQSRAAVTHNT